MNLIRDIRIALRDKTIHNPLVEYNDIKSLWSNMADILKSSSSTSLGNVSRKHTVAETLKLQLVNSLSVLHNVLPGDVEELGLNMVIQMHAESMNDDRPDDEGNEDATVSTTSNICKPRYSFATLLALGTVSGFALSAVNCISAFTAVIFSNTSVVSVDVGNVLFALAQEVVIILGIVWFYEISGRRRLLILSSAGCAIGHGLLSLGYGIGNGVSFLTLIGPLVFIASVSVGLGTLSWVYAVEVLALEVRASGLAIANILFWSISWALNQFFQGMIDAIGESAVFALFCAMSACTCAFFYGTLIETKGQTLNDITASISPRSVK